MPTLRQYRRALADDLPLYGEIVGSSASADTTSIVAAGIANGNFDPSRYGDLWVFALTGPNAGAVRQVSRHGFDPETGKLTVSLGFAATPQAGDEYELHGPLPPRRQGMLRGIAECINEALRQVYVPSTLRFVVPSGALAQQAYSLAAWPWLTEEGQVREVREPGTASELGSRSSRTWRLRWDEDGARLEVRPPFGTAGEEFEVEVARPAITRLRLGGAWTDTGEDATGLEDEDDAALAQLGHVRTVALAEYYGTLAKLGPSETRAEYLQLAGQMDKARNRLLWHQRQRLAPTKLKISSGRGLRRWTW